MASYTSDIPPLHSTDLGDHTLTEIPATVNAAEIAALETDAVVTKVAEAVMIELASVMTKEDNVDMPTDTVVAAIVEVASSKEEVFELTEGWDDEEDFRPKGGETRATGTPTKGTTFPKKSQTQSPSNTTTSTPPTAAPQQESAAKASTSIKQEPKDEGKKQSKAGSTNVSKKTGVAGDAKKRD